ncbi:MULTISPECIES: hypothetical protein [unclassified Streptomyces]|uniref:hypothetical protein n=1 Tax=unclassified Streptomyces TaxID=2593676 RepID=UPI002787A889|nr:hypothetical protein [Streptomyces sp. DSM 40167]MDQ0407505.1 hypothetical protein [Streptomyces sp. DSM 40167]
MSPRFETARFHSASGPDSLFTRVRHVLREPVELKAHGGHVTERLRQRGAPVDELTHFDPASWNLVSAEVRTDTGKWVASTWCVRVGTRHWWVVVGLGNALVTVIGVDPGRKGQGESIVTDGTLYAFVDDVNERLMRAEAAH